MNQNTSDHIICNIALYADDTTIYSPVPSGFLVVTTSRDGFKTESNL